MFAGKYKLCRGGMKIDNLKQALSNCDSAVFKEQKVLMFIGMNDLQKVFVVNFTIIMVVLILFCSNLHNFIFNRKMKKM